MAQEKPIPSKKLKLDKTNSAIVIITAVCSFVFVFSLVATKSLVSRYLYQNRVTHATQATVNQLNSDNQAAANLIASYNSFINQSTNMIGGSSTGTGNQDGTNSKLIQDALPYKYDFPALATSIENLISGNGVTTNAITGTDEGIASSSSSSSTSSQSAPIAMPFTFSVEGTYSSMQTVLDNLQSSIRPMQVQSINMTGSDSNITMTVNAQTYYLPTSGLSISSETVK